MPWALTGACSTQAGSSLELTGSFCAVLLALCVSGCVHSLIQSCVSGGFCDVHRPKGTPDTGVTNVVSRSDTLTEHTKSQSFLRCIMIPLKFQFIFCAKEGQTHCFYATWMLLVSFWKLSQNNAFLPKIYFLTLGLEHYSSVYAGKLNRKSKSKETLINSALHGKSTIDFAKAVGTILCILLWSVPFRALVNSPCRIGNGNTSFIGQAGSSTAWLPGISPQQVWVEKNSP